MNTGQLRTESDRTASIIILICMTIVAVGNVLGITYLHEYNFYEPGDDGKTAKSVAVQLYSLNDAELAKDYYNCIIDNNDEYRTNYYQEKFSLSNSSFVFCVTNLDGEVLFDSTANSGTTFDETLKEADYEGDTDFYTIGQGEDFSPLKLKYAILAHGQHGANDKYTHAFRWIDFANSLRFFLFVTLFAVMLIIIILLSIITINAGLKEDNGEIVPGFVDRIPLDIAALFLFAFFCVAWIVMGLTTAADVEMVLNNVVIMITCVAFVLVLMTFLTTLSVRVKMGKAYKNTLVYIIFRKFKRKSPRKIRRAFKEISAFKKLILGISVYALTEAAVLSVLAYFVILSKSVDPVDAFKVFLIVWGLTRLIIIPIFAMIAINLHYVKEEGQRLAQGILGDEIADKLTIASIRAHGKNLDSIKKEINKAMEQELKSEKLKSELITNVSHDLKTPLTSIKNYVELLGKEDLTEEERIKYTEIISRHTDKLNLLLHDLIEASQISSGNIDIDLEKTNLNLIIEQTIDEFSPKLEKSLLTPRVTMPKEDVFISGDGKWLWRILSNLFNNACKYSSRETELEIAVEVVDGKAEIKITNVTAGTLSIQGEELFERFVRGDSSRHTDGNGLGLSIAKSLAELQNGTMDISVIDDKFTAILTFAVVD